MPPPIGLCLAEGEDREALIAELRAAAPHASIEPGGVSPRAILVRGAGDVRRLPGVGERWIVQEEGAQVVALAAGARRGEQVLDACSGHGNKSWLLAQQVAPSGAVDASDLHPAKLDKLLAGPPGKRVRSTFAIDWTVGAGDVPENYDRVIVDAPCSGTGTLRRRPEIGRKREAEDLAGLADLQTAITRQAATRVRDGGTLLYAVCSVLSEEAEDVVARLLVDIEGSPVTLSPLPFEGDLLRSLASGAHYAALAPAHARDRWIFRRQPARDEARLMYVLDPQGANGLWLCRAEEAAELDAVYGIAALIVGWIAEQPAGPTSLGDRRLRRSSCVGPHQVPIKFRALT